MNDITKIITNIEALRAEDVNLFELDGKLRLAFSNLYHKRKLYKNNFINLKSLTNLLMAHHIWLFRSHIDCIGMSCSMEHDLATATETLRETIETRETGLISFEENAFLAVLHLYRVGVREMDEYQEGLRKFLRVAHIQYDDMLYNQMSAEERLTCPSYEMFLSNFHCTRLTYVASHGIIDEHHLHISNIGLMSSTPMEEEWKTIWPKSKLKYSKSE